MSERNARTGREQLSTTKSPAEIPPQPIRKHLTEPTWIEQMIHFAGLYLDEEKSSGEESDENKPPKSEAA